MNDDIKELYEDTENLYDLLSQHYAEHDIRDRKEVNRFEKEEQYIKSRVKEMDQYIKSRIREMDRRIEKAQKIKEDILGYTLQIVSIIIGLFGVVLAIILLITSYKEFTQFHLILMSTLLILFTIIFGCWFLLWKRMNFPKNKSE